MAYGSSGLIAAAALWYALLLLLLVVVVVVVVHVLLPSSPPYCLLILSFPEAEEGPRALAALTLPLQLAQLLHQLRP